MCESDHQGKKPLLMKCGNFFTHGKHSICVTTIKEKSYELDSKETHGKGLREERGVEIMQLYCNLRNKILLKTSTLELIKQQKTKTKWLSYLEPTDITYKKSMKA